MNPGSNYSISPRARRIALLVAVLGALSIFGACGKRGPLYLPDQAGAPAKAGGQAAKPAPPDTGK